MRRPLRTPRRRWEDNIKMNLREIGLEGVEWIHLAQDRDQCRAFANTARNFGFHKWRGNFSQVPWFLKRTLLRGVSGLVSYTL